MSSKGHKDCPYISEKNCELNINEINRISFICALEYIISCIDKNYFCHRINIIVEKSSDNSIINDPETTKASSSSGPKLFDLSSHQFQNLSISVRGKSPESCLYTNAITIRAPSELEISDIRLKLAIDANITGFDQYSFLELVGSSKRSISRVDLFLYRDLIGGGSGIDSFNLMKISAEENGDISILYMDSFIEIIDDSAKILDSGANSGLTKLFCRFSSITLSENMQLI